MSFLSRKPASVRESVSLTVPSSAASTRFVRSSWISMSGDGRIGAITASPSPAFNASTHMRISGNDSMPCTISFLTSRGLKVGGAISVSALMVASDRSVGFDAGKRAENRR